MTTEEHLARHKELHQSFDELFADYIRWHPDEHEFTDIPIKKLMEWSYQQTKSPQEQ